VYRSAAAWPGREGGFHRVDESVLQPGQER
jgi:hypothetical protein